MKMAMLILINLAIELSKMWHSLSGTRDKGSTFGYLILTEIYLKTDDVSYSRCFWKYLMAFHLDLARNLSGQPAIGVLQRFYLSEIHVTVLL